LSSQTQYYTHRAISVRSKNVMCVIHPYREHPLYDKTQGNWGFGAGRAHSTVTRKLSGSASGTHAGELVIKQVAL